MHLNTDRDPVQYRAYTGKKIIFILSAGALLLIMIFVSVSIGSVYVPLDDLVKTLFGKSVSARFDLVIWKIRLPQALAAVTIGAGLSIAGLAMQSILMNPLASPFTLGVSNAAAFGAALSVIVFRTGAMQSRGEIRIFNHYGTGLSAFILCMLSASVILGVSKIRRSSPEVMALTGVALGSLFTAATMFLQYYATDSQLTAMVFWTFGDVSRASWKELFLIAVITIACFVFFMFNSWNYNAMQSGEETAKGLGVNAEAVRIITMAAATLLTAVAVSFVGIIGFVGLISPHIARRIIGEDHRFLMPASLLTGGIVLLAADTAARTVFSPHVLPAAVLTSFIGAPVFIYMLLRGYKK